MPLSYIVTSVCPSSASPSGLGEYSMKIFWSPTTQTMTTRAPRTHYIGLEIKVPWGGGLLMRETRGAFGGHSRTSPNISCFGTPWRIRVGNKVRATGGKNTSAAENRAQN